MNRTDNRAIDRIRPVSFELNFVKFAEGSVLAKFGDTHVLISRQTWPTPSFALLFR